MAAYDAIAEEYAKVHPERPLMRYAVYPRLYELMGEVRGKTIADLGCGEGLVARALVKRGAAHVVGVDLSPKMIEIARERHPVNAPIEYRVGRVGQLGKIGSFDIVVGAWLLHYAATKDELLRMCKDIAVNLAKDGICVGVINNPDTPLRSVNSCGDIETVFYPGKEGGKVRIRCGSGCNEISFHNYFWRKRTYEEICASAGLTIEWIPILPTDEGLREMGRGFWLDLIKKPWVVMHRCRKI